MATNIEWARNADGSKGETWNPIVAYRWVDDPDSTGCSGMKRLRGWYCEHATTGCIYCYAEKQNVTGARGGTKLPYKPGHRKDIEIELHEPTLLKPLSWKRPKTIFVCSMTDLFGEFHSDEMIDRVFAVMALSPQHTFQCLTKRAERMRAYMDDDDRHYKVAAALGNMLDGDWIWNEGKPFRKRIETMISALHGIEYVGEEELPDGSHTLGDEQQINPPWPLPNVWLGVSAERQQEADERIPLLLQTPAAIRFVSLEPLLGPIYLYSLRTSTDDAWQRLDALKGFHSNQTRAEKLDWVIVGGESGPNARPMHPDWARSLRDQCEAAGVPFFFKQFGEYGTAAYHMGTGHPVFRQFATFDQWVNKASTWVNGGICLDADGGELKNGAAFMKARDEARFPVTIMHRIGKKAAGRLLDGVEHNGMPHTPTTEPIHPRPAGGNTDYLAHHPRDG